MNFEKPPWWLPFPFAVFFGVISAFGTNFFPIWVQALVAIIASTLALIGSLATAWHYRENLGCALVLLLLVVAATSYFFITRQFVRKGWPEPLVVAAPSPRIQVRLVPEALIGPDIAFHFSVKNTGPGEIEVIRYRMSAAPYFDADVRTKDKNKIAQGDELTIPIPQDNLLGMIKYAGFNITYASTDAQVVRTGKYGFTIPAKLAGPVAPSTSSVVDGIDGYRFEYDDFASKVDPEEFRIEMGFHEIIDGIPNVFRLDARRRSLFIDSDKHVISFLSANDRQQKKFSGQFAHAEKHVLFIQGNDRNNEINISIDGIHIPEIHE